MPDVIVKRGCSADPHSKHKHKGENFTIRNSTDSSIGVTTTSNLLDPQHHDVAAGQDFSFAISDRAKPGDVITYKVKCPGVRSRQSKGKSKGGFSDPEIIIDP